MKNKKVSSDCPVTKEDIINCPIRKIIKIIGGKWSLLVLISLKTSKRFWELKKLIPDISEKMLIQTLRMLEENNFIKRKDFKTIPPKVEYSALKEWKEVIEIVSSLEKIWKKL